MINVIFFQILVTTNARRFLIISKVLKMAFFNISFIPPPSSPISLLWLSYCGIILNVTLSSIVFFRTSITPPSFSISCFLNVTFLLGLETGMSFFFFFHRPICSCWYWCGRPPTFMYPEVEFCERLGARLPKG